VLGVSISSLIFDLAEGFTSYHDIEATAKFQIASVE
jgi:hypothetical protein